MLNNFVYPLLGLLILYSAGSSWDQYWVDNELQGTDYFGFFLWGAFYLCLVGGAMSVYEWFQRVVLRLRPDIVCTWCGSKRLKFSYGTEGDWYWEYRNADGSRDKRVSGNFQQASYNSLWECKSCEATSQYTHYVNKRPSKKVKVWRGQLVEAGFGDRTSEDYEKEGRSVFANRANRKGR